MTTDKNEIQDILSDYRIQIDNLDDEIVALLVKRFNVIKEVANVKKQHNINAHLQDRIDEVIKRNTQNAGNQGIDAELVNQIFTEIVDKSIKVEDEILKQ